ncbi:MAG: septation ring formation regulator EzrA [Bacilli bacterium]|nr:septation ring formation regulator EzrA [Bacilli bacterium]
MVFAISKGAILGIILGITALIIAGLILIYIFVILPSIYRKKIKTLHKKYSFLNAKLIGQDSQYFHRLEIISRTNLLFLDKYEVFSKRFKTIFENEDKCCDSIIKQLNALVKAKQYKNIRQVIDEAEKSLDVYETSVNSFDSDLYEIIKNEETCRKSIISSKETYRHIKQTYFTQANEIEMVADTFQKVFDKIDKKFAEFDDDVESAKYEEVNEGLPELDSVLTALGRVLIELPNLCSLTKTVVVEKIATINDRNKQIEKEHIPLYHLNVKTHIDDWKKRLNDLNKKIINLQTFGVRTDAELIMTEIDELSRQLDDELSCREYFNSNYERVYTEVNETEKLFVKLSSLLPQVKGYYAISDDELTKIDQLSVSVGNLTNAKRFLEGFVYSGIKQPYSLLKKQLDELQINYEDVQKGVMEFKDFIDSLKTIAENAYQMIFIYFNRAKEIERALSQIGVKSLTESYQEKINAVYDVLNDIYEQIQLKPIHIDEVSNKIEQLKNIANAMFEEIDEKMRNANICEKELVKLNSSRSEQDVNQRVKTLETAFNNGEFANVLNQIKLSSNA